MSDASGSSSNNPHEDKTSEDDDSANDTESEPEVDIHEEDLSRTATTSIENVGPETGVNEGTYTFVPTQELLPTSNSEDNGSQDNGDDMPDAQPELTVQPEDVGTRRSSGRVRKRTEVDSRCECNTLITLEEKEIGTQVMECKARGCETGWVRVICFYFRPTLT